MQYHYYENILSAERMSRYLAACQGDKRKAVLLYRLNLRLSRELFTVICSFEISLRNAINNHCISVLGNDWLRTGAAPGGIFHNERCRYTAGNINEAIARLEPSCTHSKLVAEMGFGFWRYMFAAHQYNAAGRKLLQIFPAKPVSTAAIQYNQNYVFNELARINHLRNRIAHHEPVCFRAGHPVKDTADILQYYNSLIRFFEWMNIDEKTLLYGLDHVKRTCCRIDCL